MIDKLIITGHAIDRASLKIRKIWHEDRGEEEGLHAGTEALDLAVGKEKIVHHRVQWVFKHGNIYSELVTVMRRDNKKNHQ